MVSVTKCPWCGVAMSDCFGSTGNKHKDDCCIAESKY